MSDQRRFTWRAGRLPSTPITDFWQASRTVQDPSIPNLPLETPAAAAGDAPFTPNLTVLANPVLRQTQAGQNTLGVNLLTTTLAPAVAQAPFRFVETPAVRRTIVPQPDVAQNTLPLQTVEQRPFLTVIVDLPRAKVSTQVVDPPNRLPLTAVQETAPFRDQLLTDIVRRPVSIQATTLDNLLPRTSVASEPLPFNQSDWQNPVRARVVQQPDMPQGVLELLTYVPPVVVPPDGEAWWPGCDNPHKKAKKRKRTKDPLETSRERAEQRQRITAAVKKALYPEPDAPTLPPAIAAKVVNAAIAAVPAQAEPSAVDAFAALNQAQAAIEAVRPLAIEAARQQAVAQLTQKTIAAMQVQAYATVIQLVEALLIDIAQEIITLMLEDMVKELESDK